MMNAKEKRLKEIADDLEKFRQRLAGHQMTDVEGEPFTRIPREMAEDLGEVNNWLVGLVALLRDESER